MADDDPFAVFGDDDEVDDDDENVSLSVASRSKALVNEVNSRMKTKSSDQTKTTNKTSSGGDDLVRSKDDGFLSQSTIELPWNDPLYLGPIALVESLSVGGGRGYVASGNIEPGTLILVEQPLIDWPPEQIGKALSLVSVRHILHHSNAQRMIHDLESLHPTKVDVDLWRPDKVQVRSMMEELEQTHKEDDEHLKTLVPFARAQGLRNRNGEELSQRDILRILLALRYNGIESGVYLHVAMLNHSCTPNSVKFSPKNGYSEVRTTRFVKAGEPLTISYISNITSHAYRRAHLWEQHRFDIGPVPELASMERVGGHFPKSSIHGVAEGALTKRIEVALSALEDHYKEVAASVVGTRGASNPAWEEAKALELSSLELYTESTAQLKNGMHLLLIPCLRLHLDLGDLLHTGGVLTTNESNLLLCRLVQSGIRLAKLQVELYGPDHFELARTHLEVAQYIAELLAKSPKLLIDYGVEGMATFGSFSSQEFRSRQEHERIRVLYPEDSEEYISKRK